MPTTTGDSIYYADGTTPASLADITSAMAQSVQNALNLREAHNFKFANNTEKSAQIGMVVGDIGYQVDVDTYYRYDGTTWKTWAKAPTTYTPTFTNFNATSSSFIYSIAAGVCTLTGFATRGSSSGAITMTLPVNINSAYMQLTVGAASRGVGFGSGTAFDGTTAYSLLAAPYSASTVRLRAQGAASTYVNFVDVSSSVPFVWASGHQFGVHLSYPVA